MVATNNKSLPTETNSSSDSASDAPASEVTAPSLAAKSRKSAKEKPMRSRRSKASGRKASPKTAERALVIVVGMHRSGTSALTRVMNLRGLGIAEDLMAAMPDNEKGFWESRSLAGYHDSFFNSVGHAYDSARSLPEGALTSDAASRLEARIVGHLKGLPDNGDVIVKDPRISLVLPVWFRAAKAVGLKPKLILTLRNPLEVAASLDRRDGFSYQRSLLLWLRHMVAAEKASRGHDRVVVSYQNLLDNWRTQSDRVAARLSLSLPALAKARSAAVEDFLTSALRHHIYDDQSLYEDARVNVWIQRVYDALVRAADDEFALLEGTMDEVASQLAVAGDILESVISRSDSMIHKVVVESEKVSEEASSLRDALAQQRAQEEQLRKRLDHHEAGLEAAENRARFAEDRASELVVELDGMERQVKEIIEEKSNNGADASVEAEVPMLRDHLEQALEAKNDLEKVLAVEQERSRDLKARLDLELRRIQEVESTRGEAAIEVSRRIAAIQEEYQQNRERDRQAIGIAEGELARRSEDLQKALRDLAVSESDRQSILRDCQRITEERRELLERLSEQQADLRKAAERIDELKAALHSEELRSTELNSQLQAVGREVGHHRSRVQALETEVARLPILESEILDLRVELVRERADAAHVSAERDGLTEKLAGLQQLETTHALAKAELKRLRAERTRLLKQDRSGKMRLVKLEKKLELLQVDLEEAQSAEAAAKDVQHELDGLRVELVRALEGEAVLRQSVSEREVERTHLEDALSKAQARLLDLEHKESAASREVEELLDRARQAEARASRLEAEISPRDDELKAVKHNFDIIRQREEWLEARHRSGQPARRGIGVNLMKGGRLARLSAVVMGLYSPTLARNPFRAARMALAAEQIRASGLFDEDFYRDQNWDVDLANEDPVLHYLLSGSEEGRDPSSGFSTSAYLRANPDVARSGLNPLLHYIRHGRQEGRVLGQPLGAEHEYDPVQIEGDPYAVRPDDIVRSEIARGEGFFERYQLLSESPDFDGATRFLDSESITPSCVGAVQGGLPRVSIIVPIYGQLPYTLNCLDSLFRHHSRFSFEVIVYDDASPGAENSEFLSKIDWIHYVRGQENFGFIGACNAAAVLARGEYVVMLNNDTRVVDGWLDELIDTFEVRRNVGLVGSKLFYPDGSLQEAGGIVWQDGSAWNYGRNDDSNRPEYCYARQVDYVSGAAIAMPTALWRQLGGFDGETYERAYYEDTDIAFRIRDAGLQTWMQPLSRVVHYEGKTSGTDEASGEKAYQASNRNRFLSRWADALQMHRPNAERPWRESNRSKSRYALLIDATTPTPDKDSGSVDVINLCRMLDEMGYATVFAPEDNMLYFGDYTSKMQRSGVQCLYAPYSMPLEDFIESQGGEFDVVILHRIETTRKWFDIVKQKCPNARIIYNTVDLHHIRESREAVLRNDPALRVRAEESQVIELGLIDRADYSLVVSSTERDLLKARDPECRVAHLPLIREVPGTQAPFESRSGIVFIGGFAHAPNQDAVEYFVREVWPAVLERLPNVELRIAGSKMTQPVFDLAATPGVKPIGFVQDLASYLDGARVMVAPLRFGAGAKGKVISSLSHGLPCVGSSIAAEGMSAGQSDGLWVADTIESYVDAIVLLHESKEAWARASRNAVAFAMSHNSLQCGIEVLRDEVGL